MIDYPLTFESLDLSDDSLFVDRSGQILTVEEAASLYGPDSLDTLPGRWVNWDGDGPESEWAQLYEAYLHDRRIIRPRRSD
jgi:hypothetical protein